MSSTFACFAHRRTDKLGGHSSVASEVSTRRIASLLGSCEIAAIGPAPVATEALARIADLYAIESEIAAPGSPSARRRPSRLSTV
jgi:hypothetical protein